MGENIRAGFRCWHCHKNIDDRSASFYQWRDGGLAMPGLPLCQDCQAQVERGEIELVVPPVKGPQGVIGRVPEFQQASTQQ